MSKSRLFYTQNETSIQFSRFKFGRCCGQTASNICLYNCCMYKKLCSHCKCKSKFLLIVLGKIRIRTHIALISHIHLLPVCFHFQCAPECIMSVSTFILHSPCTYSTTIVLKYGAPEVLILRFECDMSTT